MWMLPSRGREAMCQATLDACEETGMTSPGVVFVDSRADRYPNLRLPGNWQAITLPLDMATCMECVFHIWPEEPVYGWLSDDLRPRTHGWCQKMEEATRLWRLVDCADMWMSEDASLRPGSLCGAFCWGGELVRAVGWWALPGVRQAGIDDAWVELCCRRMHLRYLMDDVVVEHLQHKNGKRQYDATDEWVRDGVAYIDADLRRYEQWRDTGGPAEAEARIRARMEQFGVTYDMLWR